MPTTTPDDEVKISDLIASMERKLAKKEDITAQKAVLNFVLPVLKEMNQQSAENFTLIEQNFGELFDSQGGFIGGGDKNFFDELRKYLFDTGRFIDFLAIQAGWAKIEDKVLKFKDGVPQEVLGGMAQRAQAGQKLLDLISDMEELALEPDDPDPDDDLDPDNEGDGDGGAEGANGVPEGNKVIPLSLPSNPETPAAPPPETEAPAPSIKAEALEPEVLEAEEKGSTEPSQEDATDA